MSGVAVAWLFYMKMPAIPAAIMKTFKPIHTLLENKYYFDKFNEIFFGSKAVKPLSGVKEADIVGFRAPQLGHSPGLFQTLPEKSYKATVPAPGAPAAALR